MSVRGPKIWLFFATSLTFAALTSKWMTFLSHLSLLEFCVSGTAGDPDAGPIAQFIDGGGSNSSEEVSLTVSASVHLISEFKKLPQGMVAAQGVIPLGDWAVLENVKNPLKTLKMSFVIPPELTEDSDKNSCIILSVSPVFLPLSTRSSVCVPSYLNKTITHVGSLSVITPNSSDPICKSGVSLKLDYNQKSEQEFYLSKIEKWNVYVRLGHMSYFFFALAIAFVCFTLLRTRRYTSVVAIDKMPLTL